MPADIYLVEATLAERLVRSFVDLIPLFAVTLLAYRIGRRGLWLALPWVLLVVITSIYSIALVGFVSHGPPVGAAEFVAMLPIAQGAGGALMLAVVVLALIGAKPLPTEMRAA
jgi:hypothetical protein